MGATDSLGPQWSGPPRGQLVMGVNDLSHGHPTSAGDFTPHEPFEVDQHGFVHERTFVPGSMTRVSPSADTSVSNPSARNLYRDYGGGRDKDPEVRALWDAVPVKDVPSSTLIHTGQDYDTTEFKHTSFKPPGRERIDSLRGAVREGQAIEPSWLVKQSGRLYAMDGHHRIVAHREEGTETFPARVWDIDAVEKARNDRIAKRQAK